MESVKEREASMLSSGATLLSADSRTRVFVRDGLTWSGYFLYGYWSYVWATFGAFVPYLRSELSLDYSQAALHFSALAFGPFISGAFGDKIIRALGLTKTISLGLVLMMFGLVAIVCGANLYSTIGGAFLIGFGGNLMSQSITTSMSERFGDQRAIGISEIATIGTICTLSAPLVVSAVTKAGFDWRTSLSYSVIFFALIFVQNRNIFKGFGAVSSRMGFGAAANRAASPLETTTIETAGEASHNAPSTFHLKKGTSPLPRTYWFFFAVIFFSVAAEWTVSFWSAEFLLQTFSLSKADAVFGMSVFLLAMFLGRIAGCEILKRVGVPRLLSASTILAAVGFSIFWLARDLPINLIGLFIMGLGESNVYPLSLSQAIAAAKGSPERAAARMSMSTGSSILLAPLLLGVLADSIGIGHAYGLVAVCLIIAAVAVSIVRIEPIQETNG